MRRAVAAGVGLSLASAAACRDGARSLGSTSEQALLHADRLIGSLSARFGPLEREPAFRERRPRLARAALAPSRAFNDRSLWTGHDGRSRVLEFAGHREGERYRMGVRAGAPPPARPADYRALLRLRALGSGEYEWEGRDELAVGPLGAADLDRALTALFLAAEGTNGAEARARAHAELPRSTAALGRLFSVQTLEPAPAAGGGVTVSTIVTMRTSDIAAEFPRWARYLRKYIWPIRFRWTVYDQAGGRWCEGEGGDGRFGFRFRLHGGHLAPLQGVPRRIPARLLVRSDVSTRMGVFRVGVQKLEGEMNVAQSQREKHLAVRFRGTPEWELPFLLAPFVRASLRRPFEGEGALFALAVREGDGQTLIVRDYRLAVKESWIVRWLGHLAGTAMSDFWTGAEEEADRFIGQSLEALRADVSKLLSDATEAGSRP